MTPLQKDIIECLLDGYTITGNAKYGYRLKDKNGNPVTKFSHRTFHALKDYLRSQQGIFVANKKHIRSLSKKYWIKKAYLQALQKS